jgi:lysophospholipase L1-like esterase
MQMTTFTALGDSITLGLGDPWPAGAGGWRGWAVFLAEGLPGGQLHNLATTGAQAADVERTQLPRALELRPDVASVVVGINDTLRRGFDVERVHGALAHVIGSLSAAGAVVLTMRLPDPGRMLGMPTSLARPLARRIHEFNVIIDEVAVRFGTLHFDAARDSQVYERCMWSVDRLHPSERGHRLIACRFHDQLAAHGHPVGPRPSTEPTSPPPTRRDELTWMATKGTKWVLRRCTDLLPYLVAMAIRECFRRAGPEPPAAPALPVPSAGGPEPEKAGH